MKMQSGTPLHVCLRWRPDDVQPVGRLAWRDGMAYFEFDAGFLESGLELSPVRHKTAEGVHRPSDTDVFDGLHGMFHDSLPDGWGRLLVDRRARQMGFEPAGLTPLDRLSCVGASGIGALCYAPVSDIFQAQGKRLDLNRLAADAKRVLSGDIEELLLDLGKAGGSPAGARPKVLVAMNEHIEAIHGVEDMPQGYIAFLVKFPSSEDPEDIANMEMAYAMMAKEAGIAMAEAQLLQGKGGKSHFASRRFDRDGVARKHVHSASGLLYADIRIPSLDYRDLILLTRAVTRDQRACREMFTRAVFNVLTCNRDDHARQFSYVMERDGSWRLAPAYDLTFAYSPGGEHATSVLGHGRNITKEILLQLARLADIGKQDGLEIIERVADAVANWKKFAKSCDVSHSSLNSIGRALDGVRV